MKLIYPKVNKIFNLSKEDKINVLQIENQDLFLELLTDLNSQLNGNDGLAILSLDNQPISISSNLELLSNFISFTINSNLLSTELHNRLNAISLNEDNYLESKTLEMELVNYILKLNSEIDFDLKFDNEINLKKLLKLIQVQFGEDMESLSEKLIEYMKIVREFDKDKCFVLINVRNYINNHEIEEFYKLILYNKFKVLLVNGGDHKKSIYEEKFVVDFDFCQF